VAIDVRRQRNDGAATPHPQPQRPTTVKMIHHHFFFRKFSGCHIRAVLARQMRDQGCPNAQIESKIVVLQKI
jgi:hypothetical protein